MNALYVAAVDALLAMVQAMAQKKPATGEAVQQALLNVEIAIDRASTETAPADRLACLLNLREQLLNAAKYTCYAQPCQY